MNNKIQYKTKSVIFTPQTERLDLAFLTKDLKKQTVIDTADKLKCSILVPLKSYFHDRSASKYPLVTLWETSPDTGMVLTVLLLLIASVLKWKSGMWFSVCAIKPSLNDTLLKYLANGTDGLEVL